MMIVAKRIADGAYIMDASKDAPRSSVAPTTMLLPKAKRFRSPEEARKFVCLFAGQLSRWQLFRLDLDNGVNEGAAMPWNHIDTNPAQKCTQA